MPAELPYLASYKNVDKLFEKIAAAKQPETFTHRFLADTLGLKSTSDRAFIPLLRALGFLEATGKPTAAYGSLKNPAQAGSAIGDAIKKAYKPLFDANEKANALPSDQLKGLIAQVAGLDEGMTKKVAGTLNALLKQAKFGLAPVESKDRSDVKPVPEAEQQQSDPKPSTKPLRPEFHYNFQVHLPENGSEDTYLNIFNALRKVFG